jgi:hypothetical protein
MRSGNQDAENLVDEWCTFLENCGGNEVVYFYDTILTSDYFNCLGKHYQRKLRWILEPLMKMRQWKIGSWKSWPNERKELRPGSGREQKTNTGARG